MAGGGNVKAEEAEWRRPLPYRHSVRLPFSHPMSHCQGRLRRAEPPLATFTGGDARHLSACHFAAELKGVIQTLIVGRRVTARLHKEIANGSTSAELCYD